MWGELPDVGRQKRLGDEVIRPPVPPGAGALQAIDPAHGPHDRGRVANARDTCTETAAAPHQHLNLTATTAAEST